MSEISYTMHVRVRDVAQWTALGWKLSNDNQDIHHGHYSVLMVWYPEKPDDTPPIPKRT
jgi:hypothetical protein